MPPTGNLARNPGVCSDRELNLWPFCWFAGQHPAPRATPLRTSPYLLIRQGSPFFVDYDPNYTRKEYMSYQWKENKTERTTLVVFEWWDFGEFCFLYFYSSMFSKFFNDGRGIIRCLEKKGTNEVHPLSSRKLVKKPKWRWNFSIPAKFTWRQWPWSDQLLILEEQLTSKACASKRLLKGREGSIWPPLLMC